MKTHSNADIKAADGPAPDEPRADNFQVREPECDKEIRTVDRSTSAVSPLAQDCRRKCGAALPGNVEDQ